MKRGQREKNRLVDSIRQQLSPASMVPLNAKELRGYVYNGFSDSGLRMKYWRVFLNHYSRNKFRTEMYFRNTKREYLECGTKIDMGSLETQRIMDLLYADMKRTMLFQIEGCESYRDPITRILLLYTVNNPDVGYAQGMVNLVGPLYHVAVNEPEKIEGGLVEADVYFMFRNLMKDIGDMFREQLVHEKKIFEKRVEHMMHVLKNLDEGLYKCMEYHQEECMVFIYRWMLFMFSSDLSLGATVWLWDRLLSDQHRVEMVDYCCVAVLLELKNAIMGKDRSETMMVLQNISKVNVETIFGIADVVRRKDTDINTIYIDTVSEDKVSS